MHYLIWDFDGTLGYREGSWTGTLVETWEEAFGEGTITREHLRPHLQTGFPWHQPDVVREADASADEWWEQLFPIFERAYREGWSAGEATAKELARNARTVFLKIDRWRLFDDTLQSLAHLSERGWRHLLLSNHVPELPIILKELKIGQFFEQIFNSAAMGVEKPHSQAFANVLTYLPEGAKALMIGDNVQADIRGAEQAGIEGILVRTRHPDVRRFCADLHELVDEIMSYECRIMKGRE